MADRIVVMHDGRVEQIGTPLDLYDRPRNRFVAEFIGSPAMNLIAGTLARLRRPALSRGGGHALAAAAAGQRGPWPDDPLRHRPATSTLQRTDKALRPR